MKLSEEVCIMKAQNLKAKCIAERKEKNRQLGYAADAKEREIANLKNKRLPTKFKTAADGELTRHCAIVSPPTSLIVMCESAIETSASSQRSGRTCETRRSIDSLSTSMPVARGTSVTPRKWQRIVRCTRSELAASVDSSKLPVEILQTNTKKRTDYTPLRRCERRRSLLRLLLLLECRRRPLPLRHETLANVAQRVRNSSSRRIAAENVAKEAARIFVARDVSKIAKKVDA